MARTTAGQMIAWLEQQDPEAEIIITQEADPDTRFDIVEAWGQGDTYRLSLAPVRDASLYPG